MTYSPNARRLVLTLHISASVGWLGAIACFLPLAIIGISQRDTTLVRAAYLAMDWIGWRVLVPLSFASLVTGLIQSWGTEWGLFRHYWVLMKFLMNVLANAVLVMFMLSLGRVIATGSASPGGNVADLRSPSPLVHAGVGLILVLSATVLSVYKPRGVTPYGWRMQIERRRRAFRAADEP